MRVLREGRGEADVLFSLSADYPGFLGHFPGDPILPGMCQVLLCCEAISLLLGGRVDLTEVRRARFRRKVRPGEDIGIRLRWELLEDGTAEVRTVHTVGDERAAELHLLLSGSIRPELMICVKASNFGQTLHSRPP